MSDHIIPIRVYLAIFTALMLLTILTVWIAFVDLGFLNTIVAMSIAVVKALLVVLFFMHVKYSSSLVKVYVTSGVLWLLILIVLTLSDYVSRGWLAMPKGWA